MKKRATLVRPEIVWTPKRAGRLAGPVFAKNANGFTFTRWYVKPGLTKSAILVWRTRWIVEVFALAAITSRSRPRCVTRKPCRVSQTRNALYCAFEGAKRAYSSARVG